MGERDRERPLLTRRCSGLGDRPFLAGERARRDEKSAEREVDGGGGEYRRREGLCILSWRAWERE